MSKKDKDIAKTTEEKIDDTEGLQLEETARLIERAKDIDPLSDEYVTIQERIADSNESSEKIGKLKGKKLTKLEIAEKITQIGVGVAGIALTVKEMSGGMIRTDGCKTILRNAISAAGKLIKK